MILRDIIKKRKAQIIIVFLIISIAAALKSFILPSYETESLLMVDIKKGPTSVESSRLEMAQIVGLIRTHSDLLKSTPILRSVVEDLKLYNDSEDIPFSGQDSRSEEERIRVMIEQLQKRSVVISSSPFTNLIEIKVKYKDAQKAADIANTLVSKYIKWNIDFTHEEAGSVQEYLQKEVGLIKDKLEKSEEALKKFKEQNKILNLTEEMKVHIEKQVKLQTDYYYSQVTEQENQARLNSLRGKVKQQIVSSELDKFSGSISITAINNPVLQNFQSELLKLEIELSRIRELYADVTPQVIYMVKRIADLKEKILEATKAIMESEFSFSTLNPLSQELVKNVITLEAELLSIRAKKEAIASLIEEYGETLKGMPDEEIHLTRLTREVKINEKLYTFLLEEKEKSDLIQTKKTTENIKVISSALTPLKPKGRITNTLIGMMIGLLFSIFLAFSLEFKKQVLA